MYVQGEMDSFLLLVLLYIFQFVIVKCTSVFWMEMLIRNTLMPLFCGILVIVINKIEMLFKCDDVDECKILFIEIRINFYLLRYCYAYVE